MPTPQTEVLITVAGMETGRFILTPGDYVIGRNEDCPIRVDADLVSRQHAKLILNYDHALIEDLGSSNGTQVNGQPIAKDERTRLWPNQKIQVGTATIELRRLKVEVSDMSLAPAQAMVRRVLPEEFLREKKYDIGKVVAQGGMGGILNAREATTERTVAMKVMLDSNDADGLARFLNEAKITAQLEHPNIVPVHELSVDENGQPYYTMKFVKGITLKKVLELMAAGTEATLKKYALPALLTIFQKVCDALAFAHSKGIIHRDLKPENLMLGDYGEVLVMDWGLAKLFSKSAVGSARAAEGDPARSAVKLTLPGGADPSSAESTMAGTVMGTPQFMSPEQARGENETLDARSDIWSLGAILYQILALRVPVTGTDAMEVVGKVGRGEMEPLTAPGPGKVSHLPGGRLPDSLAAVVRKAMALDRDARYASVAKIQRDIEAYQTGFATSAEKAGWGKRARLAIKRNKATSIGAAAVLLVGTVLGTKAILEGKRATKALAELKASAPALLRLAESEADTQRFEGALRDLDAALALDPALARARWQRAWVLLGLERWSEAAAALRLARQHDPKEEGGRMKDEVGAQSPSSFILPTSSLSSILPAVEKLAAAPDAERWKSDDAREVFAHLQFSEATGAALAFSNRLQLGAQERLKLADQRLLAALGKGGYRISIESSGLVAVIVDGKPLRSLEAFRGLPIDSLSARSALLTDLEPLRGMRLQTLDIYDNKVTDLAPLRGLPLRSLNIFGLRVRDLSPLAGMKLSHLDMDATQVVDLTPLAGMPLTFLKVASTSVSRIDALRGMPLKTLYLGSTVVDCSPIKGAPIGFLSISGATISDVSFAKGMPLHTLHLTNSRNLANIEGLRGLPLESAVLLNTSVNDISPLQGAPLKELDLRACKKLTDYTPVLTLARLERLICDVLPAELLPLRASQTLQSIDADAYPGEAHTGPRPAAEFWKAYDAGKARQKK